MKKYVEFEIVRGVLEGIAEHSNTGFPGRVDPADLRLGISILDKMSCEGLTNAEPGIWIPGPGYETAKCSKCGEELGVTEDSDATLFEIFAEEYRFCPRCGAKMEGWDNA